MSLARSSSSSRAGLGAIALAIALVFPVSASSAQGGPAARATTQFEQGDFAAARTGFEAVLKENPRDASALYHLGRIALREERSRDAVDLIERAIKAEEGRSDYHLWLAVAIGEEAERASKFRQPLLARRAKSELERAVALDPRNVTARLGLVQFYGALPGFLGGNKDRARQQAVELAKVSPLHGHLAAAFLAMREKDNATAEREYERAITAAPDSAAGYLSLGALYQRLERWDDAFATYDRLIKRDPSGVAAHFQIGRTAALSGQRLARGEESIKLWLAKPPKDAPTISFAGARHRLGQIYEKGGRLDAARAEYTEALRINPRNEDARKSLAALR